MTGFGYCVWWKLHATHPLVHISRQLQQTTPLPFFEPHVSVRTRLWFVPQEIPHPSSTPLTIERTGLRLSSEVLRSWNNTTFYSLEVPVVPIWPLPRNAHLSLAYRLDRPFTSSELDMAKTLLRPLQDLVIMPHHLSAHVYDCRSSDIGAWHAVG